MSRKDKAGGKNRKFGRSSRKPSHQRYVAEKRWETNKARKAEKRKRKEEKRTKK